MAIPIGAMAAAAIPAIGSLLGGERANRERREMAREQMAFQERMSSTAYQRSVKDMRAAGINPMLAYMQGGASSPGGAMPQVADTISPAVSTAMQMMRMKADLNLIRQQTKKVQIEGMKTQAESRALYGDGRPGTGLVTQQFLRARSENVRIGNVADLYRRYPWLNAVRGVTDAVGGLSIPFTKGRR